MKRLIILTLLTTLFSLTQLCYAQKTDDVYGKDNGSNDAVKKPKKAVLITDDLNFSIDDFVAGYVILLSNDLQYGLLRFNGSKVIFMDTVTKKTTRYGSDEIKGFVCDIVDSIKRHLFNNPTPKTKLFSFSLTPYDINASRFFSRGPDGYFKADTFKVVSYTFDIPQNPHAASFGKKTATTSHFIKVMVYGPSLTLYKRTETKNTGGTMMGNMGGGMMMTGGSSYDVNVFYLKRENEKEYTELPSGKRAFRKLMADYLKDDPKLADDIKNEVLGYDDLDKIVVRYNNKTNANSMSSVGD